MRRSRQVPAYQCRAIVLCHQLSNSEGKALCEDAKKPGTSWCSICEILIQVPEEQHAIVLAKGQAKP